MSSSESNSEVSRDFRWPPRRTHRSGTLPLERNQMAALSRKKVKAVLIRIFRSKRMDQFSM
jgi:hypothetical protein